jgi:hypothetical protein
MTKPRRLTPRHAPEWWCSPPRRPSAWARSEAAGRHDASLLDRVLFVMPDPTSWPTLRWQADTLAGTETVWAETLAQLYLGSPRVGETRPPRVDELEESATRRVKFSRQGEEARRGW